MTFTNRPGAADRNVSRSRPSAFTRTGAPAAVARNITLQPTDDGRFTLGTDVEGATLEHELMPNEAGDVTGIRVNEILPDGSIGETIEIVPPAMILGADEDETEAADE